MKYVASKSCKIVERVPEYFNSASPTDSIFPNHSAWSKPGNWCWYNTPHTLISTVFNCTLFFLSSAYMYSSFENLLTSVNLFNHHHKVHMTMRVENYSISTTYSYVKSTVTPFCPTLTSGNNGLVVHYYNFIISRMLRKWNHTICSILRLAFLSFSIKTIKSF